MKTQISPAVIKWPVNGKHVYTLLMYTSYRRKQNMYRKKKITIK